MSRIFIVEGSDHTAEGLAPALEAAGHEIVGTAVATFEVHERVARSAPDLAIVDVRSRSGGDHVELAQELRRRFDLHTLFVSGSAEPATVRRLARADPAGFLARPFDDRQLRAEVELGLARRAAERGRRQEVLRGDVEVRLRQLADAADRLGRALDAAHSPADRKALVAELDALVRVGDARAVPLQKVLVRAVREARERLAGRAEVELAIAGEPWVAADEASLASAVVHLAGVVLRAHGSHSGAAVHVTARRDEAGRVRIDVDARPSGTAPSRGPLPGLAPAAALALAEAVVAAHGGEVRAEAGHGRAAARVLLPAAPEPADAPVRFAGSAAAAH